MIKIYKSPTRLQKVVGEPMKRLMRSEMLGYPLTWPLILYCKDEKDGDVHETVYVLQIGIDPMVTIFKSSDNSVRYHTPEALELDEDGNYILISYYEVRHSPLDKNVKISNREHIKASPSSDEFFLAFAILMRMKGRVKLPPLKLLTQKYAQMTGKTAGDK